MTDVSPLSAGVALPRPAGFEPPAIGLRPLTTLAPEGSSATQPAVGLPDPSPSNPDAGAEEILRNSLDRSPAPQQVNYRYGVRERTGDFYVQVLDARTSEINKTIPIEQLLDLRERIRDQIGLILDQHA